MKRVQTISKLGLPLAILFGVAACGNEETPPPRSATEMTSAPLPSDQMELQRQNAQLMQQRDQARQQLEDVKARSQQQQQMIQKNQQQMQQHDALYTKAWGAVDAADMAISDLQAKSKTVPQSKRKDIESTISDLKDKRDALEQSMKKMPAMRGEDWSSYQDDLNSKIEDVQSSVQSSTESK